MRSLCGLYIDAGYLLASAATRVTGTSLRSGVEVDHGRLIRAMIAQVESASGLPLLRVNWYDSGSRPGGVPDRTQEQIGLLPRVKLRLGRLGYSGEQKGVDLRIGLDLVAHARKGAVDLMYLVSGDDDLTEAVEEAQGHGVQVIVLAVPGADGAPHAVSRHLQREADGIDVLDSADLDAAVTAASRPAAPPVVPLPAPTPSPSRPEVTPAVLAGRKSARATDPRPAGDERGKADLVYTSSTNDWPAPSGFADNAVPGDIVVIIDAVCVSVLGTWLQNATSEQVEQLRHAGSFIPADIDRALLLDLSAKLNVYDLEEATRFELRRRFWIHVGRSFPSDVSQS
jgi:uncharacterized LabA/DUF88 family protein